jgi:hypothetical protein
MLSCHMKWTNSYLSTTNVPPAELLFNWTVRGKLPVLKKHVVRRHSEASKMDEKRQSYNKQYADNKRHAKKSSIEVGDCILIRQEKRNKLTSNFNSEPYTVTSIKEKLQQRINMVIQFDETSRTANRFSVRWRQMVVISQMIQKITLYHLKRPTRTVQKTGTAKLMLTWSSHQWVLEDRNNVEEGQIDMDTTFGHNTYMVNFKRHTFRYANIKTV